jgi:hypothetical protein
MAYFANYPVDLETQGLDYINLNILLHSISWNGRNAVVFSPFFLWGSRDSKGQGEAYDLYMEVLRTIPISNQNCFHYQTPIETLEYGKICIGTIVNKKLKVHVKSYNIDSGVIEWKLVTNWFNNGRKTNWYNVSFSHKPKGHNLLVTEDHKFYTKINGELKKVPLKDLTIGSSVFLDQPKLNEDQLQLVLGSVLGDGSLIADDASSNAYFKVGHSKEQLQYLNWKQKILTNLISKVYMTNNDKTGLNPTRVMHNLSTVNTPEIKAIRDLIHPFKW